MDNFHLDLTCEGQSMLKLAMQIAFKRHDKAVAYRVSKEKGLILYWCEKKDAVSLPFSLNADTAADFCYQWLAEQDYGKQPDHDGDNGKGWRLYNENWGHVDGQWEAFIAIQPRWAMYGK